MSNSANGSSDDSSISRDPDIERMRRLVAQYESLEGPEQRSEFFMAHGLSHPVISNYRRIIAFTDRQITKKSPTATVHIRRSTRRIRASRRNVAPPSRTYETTRPKTSLRVSRSRKRIALVIIINFS